MGLAAAPPAPLGAGFAVGVSPCPVPSDLLLLANVDALVPDRASGVTVVVPATLSLTGVLDALTPHIEAATTRQVVTVVDEHDEPAGDAAALCERVDRALCLEPLDAAIRAASGRWAHHRRADLDVVFAAATLAPDGLVPLLTRLVHDCRDTDGKPSFLAVVRGPCAATGARPLPVPALIGGAGLATRPRVAWQRYVARRLFWDTGGRFDAIDPCLGDLDRLEGRGPSPTDVERALTERARSSCGVPPPRPGDLALLLTGRLSAAAALGEARFSSLWAAGAVWVPPGEDRVEVTAAHARRWALDEGLPVKLRHHLERAAVRCPPVAIDASARVLRLEDRLRRWVREEVAREWEHLLGESRCAELEDELRRAREDHGSSALLRDGAELTDSLDVATLRDLCRVMRLRRSGLDGSAETLDDLWRVRNNVMHGRTPTWPAVRTIDAAERMVERGMTR